MSLDFHGASEYIEDFMARIDSPSLRKITIKLFNDIFSKFRSSAGSLSPGRAKVTLSGNCKSQRRFRQCLLRGKESFK
jgi:hypothetical protein